MIAFLNRHPWVIPLIPAALVVAMFVLCSLIEVR